MKPMTEDEEQDPSILSEDIKELVKAAHLEREESRPDESWRVTPAKKPESVGLYKHDPDEEGGDNADVLSQLRALGMNFDEGGVIPGQDTANEMAGEVAQTVGEDDGDHGEGLFTSGAEEKDAPVRPPTPPAPPPQPMAPAPAASPSVPAAPVANDQTYMDRANKMLGLAPDQQAAFMRLLGNKTQTGQIGAGVAGIGDAIAAGGTLGKVIPNGLGRSEDLLQGKEKAGIEGMQTIRGNQEKTFDTAQKLQAQDPNSPLSRFAQKAYGSIGKKLGIDLSKAPASLIGDITGKGVDALNTQYQNELKLMGLQLQKEQLDATKSNQQAEREHAKEQERAEATKTLADQGLWHKVTSQLTPSGRATQRELAREAAGTSFEPDVLAYAKKYGITPEEAQDVKNKRTGAK